MLLLPFDWIIRIGNSSTVSTKILPKRHLLSTSTGSKSRQLSYWRLEFKTDIFLIPIYRTYSLNSLIICDLSVRNDKAL